MISFGNKKKRQLLVKSTDYFLNLLVIFLENSTNYKRMKMMKQKKNQMVILKK